MLRELLRLEPLEEQLVAIPLPEGMNLFRQDQFVIFPILSDSLKWEGYMFYLAKGPHVFGYKVEPADASLKEAVSLAVKQFEEQLPTV